MYLRFNAQEAKIASELKDKIPSYIIDGPNLEYYNQSFSQLLIDSKKTFIIEPHIFDIFSEKKSHAKYLARLKINDEIYKLTNDNKSRRQFVIETLQYQKNRVNEVISSDPLEDVNIKVVPNFLIAPYFRVSNSKDPNLDINIKMINDAQEAEPKSRIYAGLMVTKDVLIESKELVKISKRILDTNPNGICFSVLEFDEYSIAEEYLVGYRKLTELLKERKNRVLALYGGFFNLLLNDTVDAIAHGADSGDKIKFISKKSGGGKIQIRRYIQKLRKRFSGAELDYLSQIAPELLNCSCDYCKGNYKDNGSTKRKNLIKHYLTHRIDEIKSVNNGHSFIKEIEDSYQLYAEKMKYAINLKYLNRWSTSLKTKI